MTYRKKAFPVNTRIPKNIQKEFAKKYTCTKCLDTGKGLRGSVCSACDPTKPDKEVLDE